MRKKFFGCVLALVFVLGGFAGVQAYSLFNKHVHLEVSEDLGQRVDTVRRVIEWKTPEELCVVFSYEEKEAEFYESCVDHVDTWQRVALAHYLLVRCRDAGKNRYYPLGVADDAFVAAGQGHVKCAIEEIMESEFDFKKGDVTDFIKKALHKRRGGADANSALN